MGQQPCAFPQRNQLQFSSIQQLSSSDLPSNTFISNYNDPPQSNTDSLHIQDTSSTSFKSQQILKKYIKTQRFPQLPQKMSSLITKIIMNAQHNRLLLKNTYIKDKVYYQGSLNNDQIEGYSRILFPDGAYFQGNLIKSQINGVGTLISSVLDYYCGQFKNNKAEGNGKYHCKSFQYEGEFKNNTMQGMGKLQTEDTIYNGMMIKGQKVKGKLIKFKQNLVYTGQFLKDQFYGNGRLQKNNEVYQGYFQNSKLNGKGKYIMTNGNYYIGLFDKNSANGYGVLYNSQDVEIQSGLWKDNKFVKK